LELIQRAYIPIRTADGSPLVTKDALENETGRRGAASALKRAGGAPADPVTVRLGVEPMVPALLQAAATNRSGRYQMSGLTRMNGSWPK
jgi:hypothetical protein